GNAADLAGYVGQRRDRPPHDPGTARRALAVVPENVVHSRVFFGAPPLGFGGPPLGSRRTATHSAPEDLRGMERPVAGRPGDQQAGAAQPGLAGRGVSAIGELDHSIGAATASPAVTASVSACTTCGSKWLPAQRASWANASSCDLPGS